MHRVVTPLPEGKSPEHLIELLHDHEAIIHLSPLVTGHEEISRSDGKVTYGVSEIIDVLPFGMWKQEIHFKVTFSDKISGSVTNIEAPMGLLSEATYLVAKGDPAAGEALVLVEEVVSSCSFFFKPLVEGNMVPTRKTMHERLMAKLRDNDTQIQHSLGKTKADEQV